MQELLLFLSQRSLVLQAGIDLGRCLVQVAVIVESTQLHGEMTGVDLLKVEHRQYR